MNMPMSPHHHHYHHNHTGTPPPIIGSNNPNNNDIIRRYSISSSSVYSFSENEKAIENAIAGEKERIKECESKENATDSNLTVQDLKLILKRERCRTVKLVGELANMKSMAVASQAEAEVCEEGRINGLMRRLDSLQKEKGRIIVELEREEEMVRFPLYMLLV